MADYKKMEDHIMEDKFGIKKNICFALNYLFFPLGIVLLITQKKELTKEDKFQIIRGFVTLGLIIAASIVGNILMALAFTPVLAIKIIAWILATPVFIFGILCFVEYVLAIIGRFINKDLKMPLICKLVDGITEKFVK